jgi:hypothetical protein
MLIETSSGRTYNIIIKIKDMSDKTLFPGELSNYEYRELLSGIQHLMYELEEAYKTRADEIC